MTLIGSYGKALMLGSTHANVTDLIWLVAVLFLLGALYLLFVAQNYIGAVVAVLLAIVVVIFLL